jgi:hypothetical protein
MWINPKFRGLVEPPTPPVTTGTLLARFPRNGPDGAIQELRVSLDEIDGNPFLYLRVWQKEASEDWWPLKGKGVSIRLREAQGVAEAITRALDAEESGRVGRALETVRRIDVLSPKSESR